MMMYYEIFLSKALVLVTVPKGYIQHRLISSEYKMVDFLYYKYGNVFLNCANFGTNCIRENRCAEQLVRNIHILVYNLMFCMVSKFIKKPNFSSNIMNQRIC